MSAAQSIISFPARHAACVWLLREGQAWLVMALGHGWLHGSYDAALIDARWLSENLGLGVRRASASNKNCNVEANRS
jgi:hypothetical protein